MRTLLLFTWLVAGPVAVAAPLEGGAQELYRWRVVMHFEPHPLFTPAFKAQVIQEVAAGLTPLLAGVGTVTVSDLAEPQTEPLLVALQKDRFTAFTDPAARVLTGIKTHLVTVAVTPDGQTTLAAQQLDGSTGLTTPAIRTVTTPGFDTVGRAAGLLVGREFGAVGTLDADTAPAADTVTIRFQAGARPGFERLVQPGDVFAVARIRNPWRGGPAGLSGVLREFTLLRIESPVRNGSASARVLTRFAQPFPRGAVVAGYRVMKLDTITAPVEVRVEDPSGKPVPTSSPVQVRGNDIDFLPRSDGRDRLERRGELFRANRPLRGVACLTVSVGTVGEELFPVPVTGSGPVVIRYEADEARQKLAQAERIREEIRDQLADARAAAAALRTELATTIKSGQHAAAFERATAGLTALVRQETALGQALEKYKVAAGPGDVAERVVKVYQAEIAALGALRPDIERTAADLKAVVAKANDPARFEKDFRIRELNARVRTLLAAGDVPEALESLDQIYALTNDDKVLERKTRLAAEWAPKSPEHEQARAYIAGPWRQVTALGDFPPAVDKLTAAAEVLADANDRHGLRALVTAIESGYVRLKELADQYTSADQLQLKVIATQTSRLRELQLTATGKAAAIEAGEKP